MTWSAWTAQREWTAPSTRMVWSTQTAWSERTEQGIGMARCAKHRFYFNLNDPSNIISVISKLHLGP